MRTTPTPAGTTDRELAAAELRARILAAARKVFLARGLVKGRIREIAEEVGVHEAILYQHFESKDEIFAASVFDPLEQLVGDMVEHVSSIEGIDDRAKHRLFAADMERALEAMAEVVPLLGVALASNVEMGRRFFHDRLVPLLEQWADAAEQGMKGWEHREVDPRIVMISAWGIHFGIALDAAMHDEDLDTSATVKEITGLLYAGLQRPRRVSPKPIRPPVGAARETLRPVRPAAVKGPSRILPGIVKRRTTRVSDDQVTARSNVSTKKRLPPSERRQQIIDVAREVFLKVGRDSVSTDGIANAAGINIALLYRHFRSGADLFNAAILEPLAQRLTERLAEVSTPAGGRGDDREGLAALHEQLLATLVEVAPMLSAALFSDRESGQAFYRDHIDPLLREWIEPAYQALGANYRPFDAAVTARAVFGIHLTLALYADLLDVQLDVPAVARDVSDFVYMGFSSAG